MASPVSPRRASTAVVAWAMGCPTRVELVQILLGPLLLVEESLFFPPQAIVKRNVLVQIVVTSTESNSGYTHGYTAKDLVLDVVDKTRDEVLKHIYPGASQEEMVGGARGWLPHGTSHVMALML